MPLLPAAPILTTGSLKVSVGVTAVLLVLLAPPGADDVNLVQAVFLSVTTAHSPRLRHVEVYHPAFDAVPEGKPLRPEFGE